MSKRGDRAQAKRLHDEVIERLVAQAVERLAQETLRRRMNQLWVSAEREKRK